MSCPGWVYVGGPDSQGCGLLVRPSGPVMTSLAERLRQSGREYVRGPLARLDFGLLVVIALPVFVGLVLTRPGLPRTADGYLHLLRTVEVDQSWRDGVFYPRWAPDMAFGYGYPIFNYFAPLLYLVTEAVHVLGPGFESSLKLVLIGCLLSGAGGMYALVKDQLGAQAGVLAAATYIYAPYMLRDIFVSGVYAEYLALSLMPLALWSLYRLITRENPLYLVTTSVLCGAVVMSHNISGMLFFPLLISFAAWTIWSQRRRSAIPRTAIALVLSLALVALFLLPALMEKPFVKLDRLMEDYFDFRQHFLGLAEILSPSVVPDSRSFNPVWLLNLGTAQVTLATLGLLALIVAPLARWQRTQGVLFLLVLVISVAMMLPVSTPVWKYVPLLAFTEFPGRFLGLAVLASSVLAGTSVHLWAGLRWRRSSALLLALSLIFAVVAIFAHLYQRWPAGRREDLTPKDVVQHELRTEILGTTSASECLPTWVVEEPTVSPLVAQYLSSSPISKLDEGGLPVSARAELVGHTVASDAYRVECSTPVTIQFNTTYFPGWRAFVDGRPVPVTPSYPQGLITLQVPAGEHEVDVRFGDTPVRTLANVTSGGAVLLLIGMAGLLAVRHRDREGFPPRRGMPSRLSFKQASVLILALLLLLLAKTSFIDPHTTWFRTSSPPGQVLGVQHPRGVNLEDEVLFLGYDMSSESVEPGERLRVTLYWEPQHRLGEDYSAFIHLDDLRPDYISWSFSEKTNPADLPTSTWSPGFYVSDLHELSMSPEIAPGLYALRVGLYRPDNGQRLAVLDQGGDVVSDSIELGKVRVRRVQPVDLSNVELLGPFRFGDRIGLLGYELSETSVTPGNYIALTLYWEALTEMTESYTVFVHLVGEDEQTRAQADGLPMNGMYPTWAWLNGETVEDEHLIPLEADVAPGTYDVAIGIYELETLRRLEVTTSEGAPLGDHILLPVSLEVLSR